MNHTESNTVRKACSAFVTPLVSCDSFLNDEVTGEAFGRFPSLDPRIKRNAVKRMNREKSIPVHHLSTSTDMLSATLKERKLNPEPVEKRPVGRPRKPVVDPPLPKRPVGRPRIHPVKVVDPNKPKRVAKGDRPLGRPPTKHLKEPVPKRPRGRPRKDSNSPSDDHTPGGESYAEGSSPGGTGDEISNDSAAEPALQSVASILAESLVRTAAPVHSAVPTKAVPPVLGMPATQVRAFPGNVPNGAQRIKPQSNSSKASGVKRPLSAV